MGKQKPHTPTTWDTGPVSLASLGDVEQMQRDFREWLAPRRARMLTPRVIKPAGEPKRHETDEEALTRAARQFCFERGIRPHMESAIMADPVTGKPQNPNGVMRARRIDVIESYHKRGKITARQLDAGLKLRTAWEATMRTAPAIKKVQVDTFPKPDQHIAITLDRISRYHSIARKVAWQHWRLISHVVLDNRTIGAMPGYYGRNHAKGQEALSEALEVLADAIGC